MHRAFSCVRAERCQGVGVGGKNHYFKLPSVEGKALIPSSTFIILSERFTNSSLKISFLFKFEFSDYYPG